MSETMLERMEKRSCDNKYYIPNLTTALKRAVEQKDVEAIITLASELERFKVLCGFTPAIQQFEESLKHYGREMGLLDHPAIERALNTIPQKTCCECCESEQPSHREGFLAMVEASSGTVERKEEHAMLSDSAKVIRQIQPFDFEAKLPLICDETCPAKRHCSSYPRELGNPCTKRYEQFKNRSKE